MEKKILKKIFLNKKIFKKNFFFYETDRNRKRFYYNVHREPVCLAHYEKPALSADVLEFYKYISFFSYKGFLTVESHAYKIIAFRHPGR